MSFFVLLAIKIASLCLIAVYADGVLGGNTNGVDWPRASIETVQSRPGRINNLDFGFMSVKCHVNHIFLPVKIQAAVKGKEQSVRVDCAN